MATRPWIPGFLVSFCACGHDLWCDGGFGMIHFQNLEDPRGSGLTKYCFLSTARPGIRGCMFFGTLAVLVDVTRDWVVSLSSPDTRTSGSTRIRASETCFYSLVWPQRHGSMISVVWAGPMYMICDVTVCLGWPNIRSARIRASEPFLAPWCSHESVDQFVWGNSGCAYGCDKRFLNEFKSTWHQTFRIHEDPSCRNMFFHQGVSMRPRIPGHFGSKCARGHDLWFPAGFGVTEHKHFQDPWGYMLSKYDFTPWFCHRIVDAWFLGYCLETVPYSTMQCWLQFIVM